MLERRTAFVFLFVAVVQSVTACSGDSPDEPPTTVPPGACRTNGTATGSFVAACNDCGRAQCNAELSEKAGSGWAQHYFGGDGACAAFNNCACTCLSSGSQDPLQCATSACIDKMDAPCQAAVQAAQDCLDTKCASTCQ